MIDLKFTRVSKRYNVKQEGIKQEGPTTVLQRLQALRTRKEEFWAVRDVSFDVPRGEALGIIGHNGAGKSTVLKMLASITAPSDGEIMINGRLAALIEVGSGLHPEFTGRENVFLSGSIRGMGRREITEKFDNIIDFAGIRRFVDMPIKRYSSGMHVRLGFAIAAHLDCDILLLDEVLAVGDANFRTKCYQRIDDLKNAGKTIIFISHDLKSVERLCDRAMLMQRGQVVAEGRPHDVIKEYMKVGVSASNDSPSNGDEPAHKRSAGVDVTGLTVLDEEGEETLTLSTGKPFSVRLQYQAHAPVKDASISVFFASHDNKPISYLSTLDGRAMVDLEPGPGTVEFSCHAMGLMPGDYYVGTLIKPRRGNMGEAFDNNPARMMVRVDTESQVVRGRFYMPYDWQLSKHDD